MKSLRVALMSCFLAGTANAGILSMSFDGAGEITVLPGESFQADIHLTLGAGSPPFLGPDTVSTVAITFGASDVLVQTGVIGALPGWEVTAASHSNGPLDGYSQRWAAGASAMEYCFTGPADLTVGRVVLQVASGTPNGDYPLEFGLPSPIWGCIISSAGELWEYNPDAAEYGGNNFAYGDNLMVHVVPEPGSLVLLAVGGMVLIRRRSA